MPALPDIHAIAVMLLTACALVLFAQERIALETSALIVLIVLIVGLYLFPYQSGLTVLRATDLFSGFGHQALIAVCALMIMGRGLETTGALQPVARLLVRLWRAAPVVSLLVTMVVAAMLSAVVNNTPIVVMLLPLLVGVTLSAKTSPSTVLMPFGLATVIGGTATTIGTSTNLLVVSVAHDLGLRAFGMFDFAVPMALVGLLGIAFLWLISPRLLPDRSAPISDQSARLYSAVLHVDEDSKIAGKTLTEARKITGGDLRLLDVQRGSVFLVRMPTLTFAPGDRLHVVDTPSRLKDFESALGVSLHDLEVEDADTDSPEEGEDEDNDAKDDEANKQRLVEVVVTEASVLHGSTIKRERFADEYGLYVLAIHRGTLQHEVRRNALADVQLMVGDVLLVQGSAHHITQLKHGRHGLLVLDSTVDLPDTSKAPLALGLMAAVVAAAAAGVLPISIASMAGVGAMLVTRCMTWNEAVKGLSPQVVMIIVASLALGTALIATGAADFVAKSFAHLASGLPPPAILGALMLLMALMTNILSNNAAGIIGTPIAISIANQLGLDPVPFVVAIIAGVNLSFATPMAYQTNLLVMHAGGYQFMDFVRVGVPLTILMLAAYVFVIPQFFPF